MNQLSKLKDTTLVSQLSLIGTHDSCTFGVKFPFRFTSQCVTQTLQEQLEMGVRYFDIRLKLVNGRLMAYHGLADCDIPWIMIQTLFDVFLSNNPKEIVFVRVLRADDTFKTKTTDDEWIKALLSSCFTTFTECYKDQPIGELRGKIVCINLMWQKMFPHTENTDYRAKATRKGIADKKYSVCLHSNYPAPGKLNFVNFNSRGSLWQIPIPYPKGFAERLSKEVTELKGDIPVWCMFDFPELFEHLFEGILGRNERFVDEMK